MTPLIGAMDLIREAKLKFILKTRRYIPNEIGSLVFLRIRLSHWPSDLRWILKRNLRIDLVRKRLKQF